MKQNIQNKICLSLLLFSQYQKCKRFPEVCQVLPAKNTANLNMNGHQLFIALGVGNFLKKQLTAFGIGVFPVKVLTALTLEISQLKRPAQFLGLEQNYCNSCMLCLSQLGIGQEQHLCLIKGDHQFTYQHVNGSHLYHVFHMTYSSHTSLCFQMNLGCHITCSVFPVQKTIFLQQSWTHSSSV